MRRSELEVTDFAQKIAILDRCEVVRVGFFPCEEGAAPYIVPLSFGLRAAGETLTIYFHGAREGRKMSCFAANPRVSFEADILLRTAGGELACSWATDFESVMGEGTLRLVEDAAEQTAALDAVMAHYGYSGRPRYDSTVLARTAVLALEVSSFTAKVKHNTPA